MMEVGLIDLTGNSYRSSEIISSYVAAKKHYAKMQYNIIKQDNILKTIR